MNNSLHERTPNRFECNKKDVLVREMCLYLDQCRCNVNR